MRRTGLILTIMLTLANAWTIAAPASEVRTSPQHNAHACCAKHDAAPKQQSPTRHDKSPCSGQCLMSCCRMPLTQADPAPPLLAGNAVVPLQPIVAVALHTLTDPDPIFHPPRV